MSLMHWLRRELGLAGLLSLALVALAFAFLELGVKPLEARNESLHRDVERFARAHPQGGNAPHPATPAAQLGAFYKFFDTGKEATDWLARLDAIARESGIHLGAADYRMHRTAARIDRYEIVLPLAGGYAEVRGFLEKALAQVPVMSLDQVSFRRERASDPVVEAEARFTLHLARQ